MNKTLAFLDLNHDGFIWFRVGYVVRIPRDIMLRNLFLSNNFTKMINCSNCPTPSDEKSDGNMDKAKRKE